MVSLTEIMQTKGFENRTVPTELFLRASKLQTIKIDEEKKALFLVTLVREFRKNREITKHHVHSDYIHSQIETKIQRRFPSIGHSSRSGSGSRSRSRSPDYNF